MLRKRRDGRRRSVAGGGPAVLVLALLSTLTLVAGCGTEADARDRLRAPEVGGSPDVEVVTVFAAASLTETFRALARAFEQEEGHPVRLNLAGSQRLAAQILSGAPADLFVSADEKQIQRVERAGALSRPPVVVAENGLAIVTEVENPHDIQGLEDLEAPGLSVVLAAPGVPAGRYTRKALEKAGLRVQPVSLEADVRQVLAKVALGEADAGVVYRTDLRAAGSSVTGVPLSGRDAPTARYWMGVLADAPAGSTAAHRFLEFVTSECGRAILREHGFRPPDGASTLRPTSGVSKGDGRATVSDGGGAGDPCARSGAGR